MQRLPHGWPRVALLVFTLHATVFGSTFTVTNTLDSGAGSLRKAIDDANANTGLDQIVFNIAPGGAKTIVIIGALPGLNDPVVIDATTQPGFSGTPLIELTGQDPVTGGFFCNGNGNTIRGFVINNVFTAVYMNTGSSSNRVEGNWIGLQPSGTAIKGVNQAIIIDSGSANIIGGTNAAARNVIAGSTNGAISIYGGTRNVIQGNYLGTDVTGMIEIGNGYAGFNTPAGVYIEGGSTNTVGGTNVGAGNLISGNNLGIVLNTHTTGNIIQGNVIGLNAAGNAPPTGRIQRVGIMMFTTHGNFIGGTTPGAGNVISGHDGGPTSPAEGYGLQMANVDFTVVQGNRIGTDVTGTLPVPNHAHGILLYSVSRTNTIGGTTAGARNIISANGQNGIQLRDAFDNSIQGNYIGTQVDGVSPLGNAENGIFLYSGSGNSIGGTTSAAGNVIAYNGTNASSFFRNGVTLTKSDSFTSSSGNLMRRNSFFGNAVSGIRLYDINCTPCLIHNDPGDSDAGANNLQNTPVLTNAATSSGSIAISGTLNSTPNSAFTLEFFANPQISPTGYGEGKTYIGSTAVLTDGSGNTSFESFFVDNGYTGQFISATATDSARNTSEFAADVVADGPAGAIQFSQDTYSVSENGVLAFVTVARLAGTNGTVTVHYATTNGTATAGSDYTSTSGTLTFTNGQTSQNIIIPIANDSFNEPNETIFITLDSPTGGAVLGSQTNATLTIIDDDPIFLFAGDAGATKPPTGTTIMNFPITLSQASTRTVSVFYATANITAEAGTDYLSATGRVDFLPGITNQTVPITILTDGLQEGSKSFQLSLSNPTNVSFGDALALGTIYDGTQGILQFSSAAYNVGESAGSVTVTVTRTGGTLGTVSVPFSATGISATAGSDFTATNGVLTFNNGVNSRSFAVAILGDLQNEANETIALQLGSPTGTSLGSPTSATLTIQDDDPPPTLAIQSVSPDVVLSWPTQAASFQLVSESDLLGTNWTVVTNLPTVLGTQFVVTNSPTRSNLFYRLRR